MDSTWGVARALWGSGCGSSPTPSTSYSQTWAYRTGPSLPIRSPPPSASSCGRKARTRPSILIEASAQARATCALRSPRLSSPHATAARAVLRAGLPGTRRLLRGGGAGCRLPGEELGGRLLCERHELRRGRGSDELANRLRRFLAEAHGRILHMPSIDRGSRTANWMCVRSRMLEFAWIGSPSSKRPLTTGTGAPLCLSTSQNRLISMQSKS